MADTDSQKIRTFGDEDIVIFLPDDPDDPRNWSKSKKRRVIALICILAFVGVFGSSSYAPGEGQIRELYGVNADVASTGLTVYVLGFGFAPLIWGPLSEMYGRRTIYIVSWILMIISIVPSAFVENLVVILLFRFFTGCCAACALNNGAGVAADINPNDLHALGRSITIFSFCALSGPCFGSLVGFFVAAHSGRGLWVVRLHFFLSVACLPLVFFLPETYAPKVLELRAAKLRKEGRNNARAPHELHSKSTAQLLQGHIVRPLAMIMKEPIVQGAAIWISLAYGIIYFFFEAYPVVFIEQHGIPFQLCGLMFLGILLGMILAVVPYTFLVRVSERIRIPGVERKGVPTPPVEARLKVVVSACVLMPVALFWFAWTSTNDVYWLAAAFAGVPFGYANLIIFFAFSSYASHTYGLYASSANAANTFVRSIVASIFPVVAHSIIENLGTKWGISLFGFLSLGLIPIPLIFIRYGASLRERSYFAQEAQVIVSRMRGEEPTEEFEEREKKTGEIQVIPRDYIQEDIITSDSLEVSRTHDVHDVV